MGFFLPCMQTRDDNYLNKCAWLAGNSQCFKLVCLNKNCCTPVQGLLYPSCYLTQLALLSLPCLCIKGSCVFCSSQGSLWLGCLLVSFPRASLIPGNLAGWPLCPCPHTFPSLKFPLVIFQTHLRGSPVCMFFNLLLQPCIKFYRDQGEKSTKELSLSLSVSLSLCLSLTHTHIHRVAGRLHFSSDLTMPPNIKSRLLPDFLGGAVVKNSPANARDMGSSHGPGRSHMPRSN